MNLQKKKSISVIIFISLCLLLLQICLCAKFGLFSENQYLSRCLTSEEIAGSMEVIEAYLREYHWAFYYLEMPAVEMVTYNDKTAFHLERLNFMVEDYKAFDSGYDAIWGEEITLQTARVKQNGQYEIIVYDRYNYHYKNAPADVESGHGCTYTFQLEVVDEEWKITGIAAEGDNKSPEYGQAMTNAVLTGKSVAECLKEVFIKRIERLPQEVAFVRE